MFIWTVSAESIVIPVTSTEIVVVASRVWSVNSEGVNTSVWESANAGRAPSDQTTAINTIKASAAIRIIPCRVNTVVFPCVYVAHRVQAACTCRLA